MKQRPYQSLCISAVLQAKADGIKSVLIVLPTGCGKTAVAAWIIKELKGRAFFIIHTEELAGQARDTIAEMTGLHVEIEMGELKATMHKGLFHPAANIVVASVQTLTVGGDGGGRISKFNFADFPVIFFDEGHHATSKSWLRIKETYFRQNPNGFLIGMTATPDRADEEALGQVFDEVVYEYEVKDAIEDGWLVPIEPYTVPIESLDYSKVETKAGDLNGKQLDELLRREKNMQGIVGATFEIVGDSQGIGFCASIEQARIASEIFNRWKPGMSAYVSGKTEKIERKQIVTSFKRGNIQWLWNCNCFGEGFNYWGIKYVAMACATKSRLRYAQWLGRGTRPSESIAHSLNDISSSFMRRLAIARSDKPFVTCIDFAGNSGTHKLITPADVLGGNYSDETIGAVNLTLRQMNGRGKRVNELLEDEQARQEEIKKRKAEDEAKRQHLVAKPKYSMQKVDIFNTLDIRTKPQSKDRGWDKPISEGQANFLRNNELDPDDFKSSKEASELIGEIIRRRDKGLANIKMVRRLKIIGYPVHRILNMSFQDAKDLIGRSAANGWRPVQMEFQEIKLPKRTVSVPEEDDGVPF